MSRSPFDCFLCHRETGRLAPRPHPGASRKTAAGGSRSVQVQPVQASGSPAPPRLSQAHAERRQTRSRRANPRARNASILPRVLLTTGLLCPTALPSWRLRRENRATTVGMPGSLAASPRRRRLGCRHRLRGTRGCTSQAALDEHECESGITPDRRPPVDAWQCSVGSASG
jgi:hypothetical protein